MMIRLHPIAVCLVVLLGTALHASAYPKPSPYPLPGVWELNFEYSMPKRIVVTPRGSSAPQAYWYMTYTVTNLTDRVVKFLPVFQLLTEDGQIIRSDGKRYERVNGRITEVKHWVRIDGEETQIPELIPPVVLETIRIREKRPSLESVMEIAGDLLTGEDQARDGVAIWPEPTPRMGGFSIFVGGLSGEAVILKDDEGKPITRQGQDGKRALIILRKTLRLDYQILGDQKYPGDEAVEFVDLEWVMR